MSKIGVFGGAFDPIHTGHVQLAVQAKKELKLSEVVLIPTALPPFSEKSCSAPFADRFEMTRLAFGDMNGFAVSDIEKKLKGKSYTINTVRALKEIYPKDELYLLIGGDQLYTIERWFRYEALLKECRVTAVTRAGMSYADMQEYANELGRVRVLNLDVPDISSTTVRELLSTGGDTSGMIPDIVRKYIDDRGLYRD